MRNGRLKHPLVFCGLVGMALVGSGIIFGSVIHKSWVDREIAHHGEVVAGNELIDSAHISLDGSFIIVSRGPQRTGINPETGEVLWSESHDNLDFRNLVVGPTGETFVSGNPPVIYNAQTLEVIHELERSGQVLAMSRDGSLLLQRLVTISDEGIRGIRVIDVGTGGVLVDNPMDHVANPTSLVGGQFSADGSTLAVYTNNMAVIHLVDLDEGTISTPPVLPFGKSIPVLSPDLDLLAYEEIGLEIRIVGLQDHEDVMTFPLEYWEHIHHLSFNGDASEIHLISSILGDPIVTHRVVEIASGMVLVEESREQGRIVDVYQANGSPGFVESWKEEIRFLEASGGELLPPLGFAMQYLARVLPFGSGTGFMAIDTRGFYSIRDGHEGGFSSWKKLQLFPAIYSVRAATEGYVAMFQSGRAVYSYDLEERVVLHHLLELDTNENSFIELSSDGRVGVIAIRGGNGISVVDPVSGDVIDSIEVPDPIYQICLSTNGRWVGLFHLEGVSLIDLELGEMVAEWDFRNSLNQYAQPPFGFGHMIHQWPIASLAVSPDGNHLALYTFSTVLWLMDMNTGEREWLLRPPGSTSQSPLANDLGREVIHLEFSPDGHRLLVSPRVLDGPLGWPFGPSIRAGTILIDVRDKQVIREYFDDLGEMTPPVDPNSSQLAIHRLHGGAFSGVGSSVIGLRPRSNQFVIHDSGIANDDRELVVQNLLSNDPRLPASAPGVDLTGDGVLDAADMIHFRTRP